MPRRIRPTVVHPPALRRLEVLRVEDVTSGLRRVTLTGEQLGPFTPTPGLDIPAFVSSGFDDDINIVFPYPGETQPVLPTYEDGKLVAAKGRRPLGRHYTVRRYDPVRRELDVDFVKHGVGIAATWAYRTQPGDIIHIGGPSASLGLPDGFDWLLIAGDDTAVPAIARLLEDLPDDARAQVFIEVAEPAHAQPLRALPGVEVTWLYRDGARVDGNALLGAVEAAPWWPGAVYAWVAGEQSVVRDTRRHLVNDRAVPKTDIEFVGYWKRTAAVARVDDPELPTETDEHASSEKFHTLSELLPPLAIRAAVELGIGEHISRGIRTPAALAAETGTVEWALRKFLRYLESIELLASEGEEYRLTEAGEELAEAWVIEMLQPNGVMAHLEKGFFGIAQSLRTGGPAYEGVTGRSYESLRSDAAVEKGFLDSEADGADWLVAPLLASAALRGVTHLGVRSDVSSAIASSVVEASPSARVTIAASDAHAAWVRTDLAQSIADPAARARVTLVAPTAALEEADVVLVVNQLRQYPDAAAVGFLRRSAQGLAAGARLVVFEETVDLDDFDDHDAEADLLNLTVHGSGYRTDAEVDALIAAAGLAVAAAEPIGWGDTLRTLRAM